MIQKNEKILLSILIGYFFTVFSIVVLGIVIATQTSETMPVDIVTVFENGTTKNDMVTRDRIHLDTSFVTGFSNFSFIIPFIIAGVGIWLPWVSVISGQFPTSGDESILILSFWILSMVSIPITTIFSKGIPLWRRIPYIYFIAVLIGGTAIWLWTGFGN
ncbi:hypothetical protein [Nitrosopumilus sp.]|uniref:hypothetical protein n=1 Tax=Nitrosopumilus sp. TaxID=2024843 RepID=UPI00247D463A|nr:hypothetical protein [Nitrosopumilus sp.]MCV0410147.1 hypothetical protein [Nitrosopumilus sp.]